MPSENTETRKLTAIMFTDMLGYSALSQRNEALALALLADNQALLRAQFPLFNGREVKNTGDGFLVEFPSALHATQCAVEIQRALVARNSTQPGERQIQVRIGLHVGDVVHRGNDIYGDGVNIAARIEPLAIGGGICISDTVFAQVRNKLEFELTKLDAPKLKHIEVPVEVYRVVLPWEKSVIGKKLEKPVASKSPLPAASLVLIAAVVLLAAVGSWWLTHRGTKPVVTAPANISSTTTATNNNTDSQKSVAVLPFVNLSGDSADEYLSDGMTEELLNMLAQVPGLRVPGRTSSFAFKGKNDEDIFHEVGGQLHVATVLEGSVRKAGDKLRVTAQLINVADGYHLWSEDYDGDMTNLFTFQSDVAQQVVSALKIQLAAEETRALTNQPTENPEAHRLYLLGLYHFNKGTFPDWNQATNYFSQAIAADPNYAPAYCGLADTYGYCGGNEIPGNVAFAKEKELAEQAVALDPNLAEAHFSLGLALASLLDWKEGEKEIKRSIEMNPNLAIAYDQYAWLLTCLGRHDEAIAMSKRAVKLEPLSRVMNCNFASWLYFARRYDEAIAQSQKALAIDSNFAWTHYDLGGCLLLKGDKVGAIAEFRQASTLEPEPFFIANLGYAYAVSGDRAKAEQILREFDDMAKKRYVDPGSRAYIYLGLGDKEKTYELLEQACKENTWGTFFLKVDPVFDGLRNEPRFQALLEKVFPDN